MPAEVKLPRLGQGMESGVVVKWLKSEGQAVEKGEPLYELDTDKVTQEVESPFSGVLLKIALPEGEAAVGTTIAYVGEEGEQVPEAVALGAPAAPAGRGAKTRLRERLRARRICQHSVRRHRNGRAKEGLPAGPQAGARARTRSRHDVGQRPRGQDRRRRRQASRR